uniref:Uncharacterized protein n=1 Tax=Arundo donax TaxID=35708 RepID=A0A0A8Y0A2_ARUDO
MIYGYLLPKPNLHVKNNLQNHWYKKLKCRMMFM